MNSLLAEAQQLFDAGYDLIPLSGKRPIQTDWVARERLTWGKLASDLRGGRNVGVRLGRQLDDGRYLNVIDVDVVGTLTHDEKDALTAALSEAVGGADLSKAPLAQTGFGNGSRHVYVASESRVGKKLLARSERTVPYKKAGQNKSGPAWKIELMGYGAQVVLPPSTHPDTQMPYQWLRPLNGSDDIPTVSFQGQDKGSARATQRRTRQKGTLFALDDLGISPRYKDLIRNGDTDRTYTSRSEAMYAAISVLNRATDLTDNQIAELICRPEHAIGDKAREKSDPEAWVLRQIQKLRRENTSTVASCNTSNEPTPPPAPLDSSLECPATLFELDGILNAAYEHVLRSSRYPQPLFALATALILLAVPLGSKYRLENIHANLYAVLVGHSGCGKDHGLQFVKTVLNEAKMAFLLGPDSIGSGPGIEDLIAHAPTVLITLDEIGRLLQDLTENKVSDHGAIQVLLKLYTATGSVYTRRALAGQKMDGRQVRNPCVSFYGATTPHALASALSTASTEAGWVGRLTFISTTDARPKRNPEPLPICPIPDELASWLERARDRFRKPHPIQNVAIGDPARKLFNDANDELDDWLRNNPEHAMRSVKLRGIELAKKFALVRAVGRSIEKPCIKKVDARWALQLVTYLHDRFEADLVEHIAESPDDAKLKRLLGLIRNVRARTDARYQPLMDQGYAPHRWLLQQMRIRKKEFHELIATLMESGAVQKDTRASREGGREIEVYWYCGNVGES